MRALCFLFLVCIGGLVVTGDGPSKPKSYNLEQFINASDRELRAHKKQLDELQKRGKLNITPSQAQLFYPDPIANRNSLEVNLRGTTGKSKPVDSSIYERFFGPKGPSRAHTVLSPEQLNVLNKAMEKEQEVYDKGGAVMHHSTKPAYYAHSYIRTKEHDFILDVLGTPVAPSKSLLLRDSVCRTDIEAEKEKRKEYLARGIPSHNKDWYHKENLLSCNVGLVGNSITEYDTGESTLYFWLKKQNVNPVYLDIGSESQTITGQNLLRDNLEKALDEFDSATKSGVLLQLAFKNKKKLDKIAYSARPFGYKQEYKVTKNKDGFTRVNKIEKPTDIIDAMMQQPSGFEPSHKIDTPQMRVVLTADKLLDAANPEVRKSVEINAYTENQETLDKFHTQVDTIFARAKEDYLARYRAMSLPQKFWHKLKLNLFHKRTPYKEQKRIKEESQHWFIAQ